MEKFKTELSATVGLSAGLLIASGYLVTLLRLRNAGLPTEGVLSALPDSFYLGVAVENLFVPMITLATIGVVWIALAVVRTPTGNVPDNTFWIKFGVVMAGVVWALVHLASPFPLTSNVGYIIASIAWAAVAVGSACAFGAFARWRVRAETATIQQPGGAATAGDQLLAGGAAVVLACVVAAIGFLAVDAYFKERAFAAAVLYTDREDCREVAPTKRKEPGCPVAGFYIGESDKWFYIFEDPRGGSPERG